MFRLPDQDGKPEEAGEAAPVTVTASPMMRGELGSRYGTDMAQASGVQVDLHSLQRGLDERGYDELTLEFVTEHPRRLELVQIMTPALLAVNEQVQGASGAEVSVTVNGASLVLNAIFSLDAPAAWATAYGSRLEADGLSGVLRLAQPNGLPRSFYDFKGPRIAAFAACHEVFIEHPATPLLDRPLGFAQTPQATWFEYAAEWASDGPGDVYVGNSGNHEPAPKDNRAEYLYDATAVATAATITRVAPSLGGAARVVVSSNGQAVYESYGPADDGAARIARAREALLANKSTTRLAFVATLPRYATGWASREQGSPRPPFADAHLLRRNTGLWSQYVPDVHGIQLLAGSHMDRISDLSQWAVTDVGEDRHLVEAHDLFEWFSPGGPSAAVLARGRADFGSAILSADQAP